MGITGSGVYRYPDGMIYEGELHDGQFHGVGQLFHPNGHIIRGTWTNGEMNYPLSFSFSDGLRYKENDWKFCTAEDRRFSL